MTAAFCMALALVAAEPTAKDVVALDNVLVIYNAHHSLHNDRGTTKANIYLARKGKVVWQKKDVEILREDRQDAVTQIPVPKGRYDGIRVEVLEWHGYGGGLSEIELWQRGKNIAAGTRAGASSMFRKDPKFGPQNVTDGITNSNTNGKGYWLLEDIEEGWVEIYLNQPSVKQVAR
jgi:hypothetical protein